MARRSIKFIWGASDVIRGRWLLGLCGFYDRREGKLEDGIAISVRGMLAWAGVLAVLGWVALATVVFWIWQGNPYNLLGYTDALLYPLRRAEIAEKKGQAFIAQGLDLWRAKKWQDATNLLKLGLTRFPRDYRARQTLATFYHLTNQRARAMAILTDVPADEYPGRTYLDFLFKLAGLGEDFDLTAGVCARFQPVVKRSGQAAEYRWLVDWHYGALTAAGRHAEALALAEAAHTGDTKQERRVMSLLALNRTTEALAVLAEWRGTPGADLRIVSRIEVRALREAGRYAEMERALAEMRERSAGEAAPLVYAVVQQALAGRETAAGAALDDYVFRFGGFAENLLLAADPLSEIGHLALLEQCVQAARARGYPLARYQRLLIQTQLGRGEWDAAGRVLDTMPPPAGPATGSDAKEREWWRLLLEAARSPAEVPQRALVEFLQGGLWPVPVFRQSISSMLRAGRTETARSLLDLAVPAFPASQWLQAKSAEVKAQLSARASVASVASTAADPAVTAEGNFVKRLDHLLTTKNWAEAARHIAQIQTVRPAPIWLDRCEAAIGLAQIRMAQAQPDRAAMGAAARRFLDGGAARARDLLELAREVFDAGDRADAVALARSILDQTPDFAPAERALLEWNPIKSDREAPKVARAAVAANVEPPASTKTDVWLAQLRARHRAGDLPGLRSAARQLLTSDRATAEAVLTVARELLAGGDKESAGLLIKEVLRQHENYPPALRLQNELNRSDPKGSVR